jgi:hypothetical protein
MSETELWEFGTVKFQSKDELVPNVKVDKLAHDGQTLEMISIVASGMEVKAARAMLHSPKGSKPFCSFEGIVTVRPSLSADAWRHKRPESLFPSEEGYKTYIHKLEYGLVHATLISKDKAFLRTMCPETIWLKLKSDEFTTPILRSWMPYITKALITKNLLRECRCYRLHSGVLTLSSDKQLDEIVSEGIQSGQLSFSAEASN